MDREDLAFNYGVLGMYPFAQNTFKDDVDGFLYATQPFKFYIYNLNNEIRDVATYMDVKTDRHGNLFGISDKYYPELKKFMFSDELPEYLN